MNIKSTLNVSKNFVSKNIFIIFLLSFVSFIVFLIIIKNKNEQIYFDSIILGAIGGSFVSFLSACFNFINVGKHILNLNSFLISPIFDILSSIIIFGTLIRYKKYKNITIPNAVLLFLSYFYWCFSGYFIFGFVMHYQGV